MKKFISLLFFVFLSHNSFTQCYTTVVTQGSGGDIIAKRTDGSIWGRGPNLYGNLGNGTTGFVNALTQIGTDTNWTNTISAGGNNTFAIKTNGTLWVWGQNNGGSLGLGLTDVTTIVPLTQVGTATTWIKVVTFGRTPLAIKNDGTLWSWGTNIEGKLGTGNTNNSYQVTVPTQVGTTTNWQSVYAGTAGNFAIKTDGTLWSWGSESPVQLGYPDANVNNAYRIPHQVGTDTNWATVSVGSSITCGIKTDGTLWAWGSTNFGSANYLFGNGIETYTSITPIQIGTDTNWATISVDSYTITALKSNGTRWGWGYNTQYQLGMGLGMNTLVTVPTQSDTATDWVYTNYYIGLKQNSSLYYWFYLSPGGAGLQVFTPTLYGTDCSLATKDFTASDISVYPNPVSTIATIRLNEIVGNNCEVKVVNNLGQTVYEDKKILLNDANEFLLNMANIPSGVYTVRIKSNTKVLQTKIIKK
jgi:alpha-tubulin suppressor-like RCC1 family protein